MLAKKLLLVLLIWVLGAAALSGVTAKRKYLQELEDQDAQQTSQSPITSKRRRVGSNVKESCLPEDIWLIIIDCARRSNPQGAMNLAHTSRNLFALHSRSMRKLVCKFPQRNWLYDALGIAFSQHSSDAGFINSVIFRMQQCRALRQCLFIGFDNRRANRIRGLEQNRHMRVGLLKARTFRNVSSDLNNIGAVMSVLENYHRSIKNVLGEGIACTEVAEGRLLRELLDCMVQHCPNFKKVSFYEFSMEEVSASEICDFLQSYSNINELEFMVWGTWFPKIAIQ